MIGFMKSILTKKERYFVKREMFNDTLARFLEKSVTESNGVEYTIETEDSKITFKTIKK